MTADTFDSILGLLIMGTGNDNNAWGTNANTKVFAPTARAIAGVNTIGSTGGSLDLSGTPPPAALRQDIDHVQLLNGLLVSDLTITVPNLSKSTRWWNNTTGAFNVFVKVPGGVARTSASAVGGLVQIPQGCSILVTCDGNGSLIREDDALIGTFSISGKATAGPGEIACSGASQLRAGLPDLFGKIGTTWGSADGTHFTMPLLTDTNRYLRAGGGSGPAVGTYQANQNLAHSHTVTGAPSLGTLGTDSQGAHAHSVFLKDNQHSHGTIPVIAGKATTDVTGNNAVNPTATGTTGTASSNITIGSVNGVANDNATASAGAHTHNVTGAPGLGTLGTASQGGTEARPESAAVLICIRY